MYRACVVAVFVLLLASCGAHDTVSGAGPQPVPAESTGGLRAGMPRFIVVMEENHSASQILGNPGAPALNRLANSGTLLTAMFATRHPSLPNYIALLSGDTHGITSDCGKCSVKATTLANQLDAAGISWK